MMFQQELKIEIALSSFCIIQLNESIIITSASLKVSFKFTQAAYQLLVWLQKGVDLNEVVSYIMIQEHPGELLNWLYALSSADNLMLSIKQNDQTLITMVKGLALSSVFGNKIDSELDFQFSDDTIIRMADSNIIIENICNKSQVTIHSIELKSVIFDFFSGISVSVLSQKLINKHDNTVLVVVGILKDLLIIKPVNQNSTIQHLLKWPENFIYNKLFFSGYPLTQTSIENSDYNIILREPQLNLNCAFFDVVGSRKTTRSFNSPLTIDQLSTFLHYSLRTKIIEPGPQERSLRNYPSAGGIYEIEADLLIKGISRIRDGYYRYDPLNHQLIFNSEYLTRFSEHHEDVLKVSEIQYSTYKPILFVFTSNFKLSNKKYGDKGVGLTSQTLGAIYQTMYLVATAMRLGSCVNSYNRGEFNTSTTLQIGGFLLGGIA